MLAVKLQKIYLFCYSMFVCLFALCSSRAIQFTYYLLKFCTGSISPSHHSERPAQLKMVMTPQTNCSLTKSVCLSSIVCTNFCAPSCFVESKAKFLISYLRKLRRYFDASCPRGKRSCTNKLVTRLLVKLPLRTSTVD